jgi:hypothetical protein
LNRQRQTEADIAAKREEAAETGQQYSGEAERAMAAKQEELRNLQRYQALQRSMLPEGAGQQEQLKILGKQGLKEFEDRAARIQELRKQLGMETAGGGAATGEVVSEAEKRRQRERLGGAAGEVPLNPAWQIGGQGADKIIEASAEERKKSALELKEQEARRKEYEERGLVPGRTGGKIEVDNSELAGILREMVALWR